MKIEITPAVIEIAKNRIDGPNPIQVLLESRFGEVLINGEGAFNSKISLTFPKVAKDACCEYLLTREMKPFVFEAEVDWRVI